MTWINFGRSPLNRNKRTAQRRTLSTPMCHRELLRFMAAILVLVVSLLLPGVPVEAQPCTADEQCRSGLDPNAQCIGDTLVVKRNVCLGGTCREIEERREDCRAQEASRCRGAAFEQTSSRCDALQARCVQIVEREVCMKSCDCRDKTLSVSAGQCLANLGCNRLSMQCEHGCTCTPEPKCLDAPAKE
jgi:hypothetical protein